VHLFERHCFDPDQSRTKNPRSRSSEPWYLLMTIPSPGGQGASYREARAEMLYGGAWGRDRCRRASNRQLLGKITSNFNYVFCGLFWM